MKEIIKQLVRRLAGGFFWIAGKSIIGRYFHNQVLNMAMGQTLKVFRGSLALVLPVPNSVCRFRAETFSTKEPETLEWIDNIPKGAVLWDVGANIGLYSVYAAKQIGCRVFAFEPSVFNLELLARNIFLNGVTDQVCLVPLALSDGFGPNRLHMTTTEWGGALSTFGQDYGFDGKAMHQVFQFQTLGVSMEDAVQRLGLPQPDYIKMDVDGIEHLILKGGQSVLGRVKGILIEVNDDFRDQSEQCQRLLGEAGLMMKEKRHSKIIENSMSVFKHCYNQIWVRP